MTRPKLDENISIENFQNYYWLKKELVDFCRNLGINTSGGKIDSNLGVRRVNFVQSEKDGNPGGVATGVTKLGGVDNGGTRLWWDTTGPNF